MSPAQGLRAANDVTNPNDLESWWLPFTANRSFKARPRIVARAKDMYYYTTDGKQVMDGSAGLWCVNAGHNREPIVEAIQKQAAELDFAPAFQFAHPKGFTVASRLAELAPGDLDQVFFCNSGSEAADTALKIAIAYWHTQGQGQRSRLIGRERGYHGVGFGGISVGGIVANRKVFGSMLAGVDHLPHTYNRSEQAFSRGEPEWGAHLADDLERIVALHDASTIAAVIVEPMAGVIVRKGIYEAFMKGPEHVIELFHGYTYSGHPLACAAALATLDVYRDEKLFERARGLEDKWADAIFSLKGLPNVLDIRTIGLVGAIDLASRPDAVGQRGYEAMERGFHEHGLMFRVTGDTIALSPPLIVTEDQIGEIADKVAKVIRAVA